MLHGAQRQLQRPLPVVHSRIEQLVEPELEQRDQLRLHAGLLNPRPLEVGDRDVAASIVLGVEEWIAERERHLVAKLRMANRVAVDEDIRHGAHSNAACRGTLPRRAARFRKNGPVSSTANLGLEGVVAFETEIAEPDKEGSALRYRGVDIEELAGHVPFEQVWGLVVNESLERGLPLPAPDVEPVSRTGDARIDLQATLPTLSSHWGLRQLVDIDADQARDDLARLS